MRLLDLFCGAGGCSRGYELAGFTDIVGVDIKYQKRYPYQFAQEDALEYLEKHGSEFDVIHASPPCQAYSKTSCLSNGTYQKLISKVRRLLFKFNKPYIIENVMGAPLVDPIRLCGTMFGLKVYRHRIFETSIKIIEPFHFNHPKNQLAELGKKPKNGQYMSVVGKFIDVEYAKKAMGIDWMIGSELSQAIPPAYTEYIGTQILQRLVKQ